MSANDATVRVVTWNVHGSVGRDGRCDPGRTIDAIHRLRPDILALQEIDGRAQFGRRAGAFERMAEALGGHIAEARLVGRGERAYGHLLWSRWPLEAAALHRLPGGKLEPRGVIDATCRTPHGPLRILAAHFGLVPFDRRRQARFVAGLAASSAHPTIALGDFNDWRLAGGSVHREIGLALPGLATTPTWPARRPFVRMDRIYASAGIALAAVRADPAAAAASDHLPLIADLRLRIV